MSFIVWGNSGVSWSLGPGLGGEEAGKGAETGRREMGVRGMEGSKVIASLEIMPGNC